MRVPHWKLHVRFIRFLFVFLLGITIGAVLMVFYIGGEIDQLYQENILLRSEIEKKRLDFEREQESWERRNRVKDVVIHLENAPNGVVEAELLRHILQDTRFLIGKEISAVEAMHESLLQLFSRKRYTIESQQIVVNLQHLIISPKVHLYIRIEN